MDLRKYVFSAAILLATSACRAECHDDGSVPGDYPFASDEIASSFIAQLQSAVLRQDRDALAGLIHFPVLTSLGGKKAHLSRATLMSHFGEVFNAKVLAAISSARFKSIHDYSCVFWNPQGMMLGDGEIWFDAVHGSVKIVTVNNN